MARVPVMQDGLPLMIGDPLVPAMADEGNECLCCDPPEYDPRCNMRVLDLVGTLVDATDCNPTYRFTVVGWPATLPNENQRTIWWGEPSNLFTVCPDGEETVNVCRVTTLGAFSGSDFLFDVDNAPDWSWIEFAPGLTWCTPRSVGFILRIRTNDGGGDVYHYYKASACFYQVCDSTTLVKLAHHASGGDPVGAEECACGGPPHNGHSFAESLPDTVSVTLTYVPGPDADPSEDCDEVSGTYLLNTTSSGSCHRNYRYAGPGGDCTLGLSLSASLEACGEGLKISWSGNYHYRDPDDDCGDLPPSAGGFSHSFYKPGCTGTDTVNTPEPPQYDNDLHVCDGGYISTATLTW